MEIRIPRRLGLRTRWTAVLVAVLVVLVGGGTWTAVAATGGGGAPVVHRSDRFMDMPGARIDTSYFVADGGKASGRRPAVLLAHGFGGSKADVRSEAERLARDGYAVLTWSSRGFGKSTGKIGLNDPAHEVKDVSRLIDWLARQPQVELDGPGDPRVGVTGASYGGAISLLAAGYDRRVDAIAPEITYWNLADALLPGGVFKKLWAGIFFSSGGGCGRFEASLCELYQRIAVAGKATAADRALLEKRSPSAVADRIDVPSLIVQGQTDSLFPLGQADAMAKTITHNGAPVSVDWMSGGHDGGDQETGRIEARVSAWFGRYLKGDKSVDTGPAFRVTRTGGIDSTDGAAELRGAEADRYPGLRGDPKRIALTGGTQTFANPAGGNPPSISAVPGLGGLGAFATGAGSGTSGSGSSGGGASGGGAGGSGDGGGSSGGAAGQLAAAGLGLSFDFPGQYARFVSRPLTSALRITGSPTVRVKVASSTGQAVLFGKVYDVAPGGGRVLPSQLVTPVRVDGAKHGRTVTVTLPAVDHQVPAGHRLEVVLAATDLGYASPAAPATYTASLAGGSLSVPTDPALTTGAAPLPWWVWGLPAAGLVVAAALLLGARRRGAVPAPDPALAEVPLAITGLTKRYAKSADRYAVRDLSFRVEKGQVLGLLGPNGAGKTTTLRMLMGLIAPDAGEARIFGHAVRPGAPVLSRVGSFVEGAGFLPHLTGRANLELYWRATGRPAQDAHIEEALEIAGLGDALARAVRTYSQGMRQRLAIAQAMLGLPDLLILDEPTNGLDPPQIREMRDVMIKYAADGRTVIVSSHLLSEVEQSCTHLVVMHRGQLVQAGPVAEITGSGDTLLVTTEGRVPDAEVAEVAALPGVASAVRTDAGLLVRLAGATTNALVTELLRLDVRLTGIGPHRRLEDAFLTLISDGGGAADDDAGSGGPVHEESTVPGGPA
ncbi:alpha/beta fold hydrolase [Streptomyces bomunensis]|uniref:Alpha/beta fold hydrolase n=1 Tax=Streptomyces montanisoli TaxID=2798581 RepID=A0A940MBB6_9ACTN|nr:alpha/beta fold hydrolase [Streptomyces montanisoli]MBP0459794.1 alpha/beta fold hydrolase [Streptomyces montanisoli]